VSPPEGGRPSGRLPRRLAAALLGAALAGLALVIYADTSADRPYPPPADDLHPPATTAAPRWHVLGLGDSITAGQGCDGCTTFLDIYASELGRTANVPTTVTNLGVGGWTSADLLGSLSDPRTIYRLGQADVVVVTIGANDFSPMLATVEAGDCGGPDQLACFDDELDQLRTNLTNILTTIQAARQNSPTAIRVTGYWNVFLDGQVANQTYGSDLHRSTNELTKRVDDIIRQVSEAHQAVYVDLYAPFKGNDGDADDTPLLGADGTHPARPATRASRTCSPAPATRRCKPAPDPPPRPLPAPPGTRTSHTHRPAPIH